MSHESLSGAKGIENFNADGRRSLEELYQEYFKLLNFGWTAEVICYQEEILPHGGKIKLPVWGFLSPRKTESPSPSPSLWILGVIHGEEPASANAFVEELETLRNLPEKNIPVVAIFVANASGYHRDWRYSNAYRSRITGHSVSDSEHLLPHKLFRNKPRRSAPTSLTADAITRWVLDKSQIYEPFLVMDHHEDEINRNLLHFDWKYFYSYVYGKNPALGELCEKLRTTLEGSGYTMQKSGLTRFLEPIKNGFVVNSHDGSVDDLLAADKYIDQGKVIYKKAAEAVFVVETVIHHSVPTPLSDRVGTHRKIIQMYEELWNKLIEQKNN